MAQLLYLHKKTREEQSRSIYVSKALQLQKKLLLSSFNLKHCFRN